MQSPAIPLGSHLYSQGRVHNGLEWVGIYSQRNLFFES